MPIGVLLDAVAVSHVRGENFNSPWTASYSLFVKTGLDQVRRGSF